MCRWMPDAAPSWSSSPDSACSACPVRRSASHGHRSPTSCLVRLGDLGILTLATGLAYSVTSLSSGRMTQRFRAGAVLVASAIAAAGALALYSGSSSFWVFVIASIPLGFGGGALDATGNGYVAVRHGTRPMGAIHAAFGLGAMLAPLLMTAIDALGGSWRVGFAMLAAAEIVLAVGFWLHVSVYRMPMEGRSDAPARTGSIRLLGLSVATFFAYAGVEGSTGFWAFTLLTEGQGVSSTVAGIAVAAHWGALFVSRVLIGVVGDRLPLTQTVTVSMIVMVGGLLVLWWNPSTILAITGLVVAGFGSGPVFPLEVFAHAREIRRGVHAVGRGLPARSGDRCHRGDSGSDRRPRECLRSARDRTGPRRAGL